MVTEQFAFHNLEEINNISILGKLVESQLVFMFGSKEFICNREAFNNIKSRYPSANIIGCTTAGEIFNDEVNEGILTVTAVLFENTKTKLFVSELNEYNECYEIALEMAKAIPIEDLKHVFVLGEGINMNGSKLVKGFVDGLPKEVKITGGLAGDYEGFIETYVIANNSGKKNIITAVAFYGSRLKVGYGSAGGFNSFGIERIVTKSENSIVYEFDGKPALDLYKEYLGEYASELPVSGLFFPLSIRSKDNQYSYVRTILAIDEENKSLKFAGEIPEGYYAKLMRSNFGGLISGSQIAAESAIDSTEFKDIKLAILVSCRGRRFILNQMVDEEIEAVRNVLGNDVVFTGFYSNGEIAPLPVENVSEFHNQTMTITILGEE